VKAEELKEPEGRRFPRAPVNPVRGLPAAERLCACYALVLRRPSESRTSSGGFVTLPVSLPTGPAVNSGARG
jgi:hypothetical protein